MNTDSQSWFAARTSRAADWPLDAALAAKRASGESVSVVVPARNESASIAEVVRRINSELVGTLVDELVVIDSLSEDDTAAIARGAGATVHSVTQIRPDLGVRKGKGEALWKAQFVTSGSLLVFIDADLTEWGTHFVTGLLGPLLADREVVLARGFYDRMIEETGGTRSTEGGRVTELTARPLLASRWPDLGAVVQPLAGEWAIRRDWFAQLPVPVGYGIEFSTLVDTYARRGLDAIAQVDLGARDHRHQHVHDLSAMALEILSVADRRHPAWGADRRHPAWGADKRWSPTADERASIQLDHFDRNVAGLWQHRDVPVAERPPFTSVE